MDGGVPAPLTCRAALEDGIKSRVDVRHAVPGGPAAGVQQGLVELPGLELEEAGGAGRDQQQLPAVLDLREERRWEGRCQTVRADGSEGRVY